MKKLAALAAVAAAAIVTTLAATACSEARASPAIEVLQEAPASVAVEVLPYEATSGRLLNSAGTYTQGLNVVEFDVYPLSAGVQDTGYRFNAGDVILDSWLVVTTQETADAGAAVKTLDVGIRTAADAGTNADGFLDGISTAATGTILPATTITAGTHTSYASATTFGDLLITYETGSDIPDAGASIALAAKGDEGVALQKHYVIGSSKQLVYQLGAAHSFLRAKGYVLFWRKPG